MRRYDQLLFRTARSILKSNAEAEDALQEAYLRAWQALGSFSWRRQALDLADAYRHRRGARAAAGGKRRPRDPRRRHRPRRSEPQAQGTSPDDDADQRPERVCHARRESAASWKSGSTGCRRRFGSCSCCVRSRSWTSPRSPSRYLLPEATVRTRFLRARNLLREGPVARSSRSPPGDAFPFAGALCDRIVSRPCWRTSLAAGLRRRCPESAPSSALSASASSASSRGRPRAPASLREPSLSVSIFVEHGARAGGVLLGGEDAVGVGVDDLDLLGRAAGLACGGLLARSRARGRRPSRRRSPCRPCWRPSSSNICFDAGGVLGAA